MENKKILITGGCGFIGTNLTKYLYDRGYRIRILDNLSAGTESNLRRIKSQISEPFEYELIIGDIRNLELVNKSTKGVDAVVHLAAHNNVIQSLENPKEAWDINVNGIINLLEACRWNKVDNFVFASSNAAVGEQTPPIDETKVPNPLSPYGASKLAGEALCSAYYHSFGLRISSLRFANCYGPYSEHKNSVIVDFMKRAKSEKPLIIYGDGNQTRDFIHVYDICHAIYLALAHHESSHGAPEYGEVFQIASGVETTINQLANLVREISGNKLTVIHEKERKGEIRRNYSDITKATKLLGFEPRVTLTEGLRELWELVLSN